MCCPLYCTTITPFLSSYRTFDHFLYPIYCRRFFLVTILVCLIRHVFLYLFLFPLFALIASFSSFLFILLRYVAENWVINKKDKNKIVATVMLRRSYKVRKLERKTNKERKQTCFLHSIQRTLLIMDIIMRNPCATPYIESLGAKEAYLANGNQETSAFKIKTWNVSKKWLTVQKRWPELE